MYGRFFVLFAIIATGYILRKTNFIDEKMNDGVNKIGIYVAFPCLIVHNIGILDMTGDLFYSFLLMVLISLVLFGIYSVFAALYRKVRKFPSENSNIAELAMIIPNNAFMGFPVALIFFGQTGLFMMLANNAAMNICLFSYGMWLIKKHDLIKEKTSMWTMLVRLLKILVNPNILALILGMVICLLDIQLEGTPVDDYLTIVGNVATPMAMIYIGSTLSESGISQAIMRFNVIESSLIKVVIFPALTFVLIMFLPVAGIIKSIVILGAAFPTAVTVSMLAQQGKQDNLLASQILFVSTLLSMATIPMFIHLIESFI